MCLGVLLITHFLSFFLIGSTFLSCSALGVIFRVELIIRHRGFDSKIVQIVIQTSVLTPELTAVCKLCGLYALGVEFVQKKRGFSELKVQSSIKGAVIDSDSVYFLSNLEKIYS